MSHQSAKLRPERRRHARDDSQCRVGYRWLCYYEGLKDSNGYSHDCFSYPEYLTVGPGVHPGPGFFYYERVHGG